MTKMFRCFPIGTTSVLLFKYLLLLKHSFFGVPTFSETPVRGLACLQALAGMRDGAVAGTVGPRPWDQPGPVLRVGLSLNSQPRPSRLL